MKPIRRMGSAPTHNQEIPDQDPEAIKKRYDELNALGNSMSVNVTEFDEEFMRPSKEILAEAQELDIAIIGKQIIEWLEKNVSLYVDSHKKDYSIDLIIEEKDPEDGVCMSEVRKLNNLYRAIDDREVDEAVTCRMKLDDITDKVLNSIRHDKAGLWKVFEALAFFYELKCVYKGEMIVDELQGEVIIHNLLYEAFSVGVMVSDITEGKPREKISEYVVPEGFNIELEFIHKAIENPLSLF